ncbi:unnamed protein product [Symbiodinium sp. CCMP2592]|nr:unnamed protein product [Symbiodinium sp. CCMP2592]
MGVCLLVSCLILGSAASRPSLHFHTHGAPSSTDEEPGSALSSKEVEVAITKATQDGKCPEKLVLRDVGVIGGYEVGCAMAQNPCKCPNNFAKCVTDMAEVPEKEIPENVRALGFVNGLLVIAVVLMFVACWWYGCLPSDEPETPADLVKDLAIQAASAAVVAGVTATAATVSSKSKSEAKAKAETPSAETTEVKK